MQYSTRRRTYLINIFVIEDDMGPPPGVGGPHLFVEAKGFQFT